MSVPAPQPIIDAQGVHTSITTARATWHLYLCHDSMGNPFHGWCADNGAIVDALFSALMPRRGGGIMDAEWDFWEEASKENAKKKRRRKP